jgi:hypothetical protein
MDQLPAWFQALIGIFQIVTGLGTLFILLRTIKSTERLKRVDMLAGLNVSWDRIVEIQTNFYTEQIDKIKMYYKRFWELQYNQYIFWVKGHVDQDIFRSWMNWRHDESLKDKEYHVYTYSGYTYLQAWNDNKEMINDKGFSKFIDDVFRLGADGAIRIRKEEGL